MVTDSFFVHVLVTAIAISLPTLLILGLKGALKLHLSMRWQYNLDFLFLILLLIPFIPGDWPGFFPVGKVFKFFPFYVNLGGNPMGLMGSTTSGMMKTGWLTDVSISVGSSSGESLSSILLGIWLLGVFVSAGLMVWGNRGFRLVKESMKPVEDEELLALFDRCKKELGIEKKIRFCTSILVTSPVTTGVFFPCIILPGGKYSANRLRFALLHELTHCKYGDLLVNGFMCLFQILYWFHPLVYVIFRRMRLDRELACDTSVLKRLPRELHLCYGETLLGFVKLEQPSSPLVFSAEFGGKGPSIVRRVRHIASFTRESGRLHVKSICVFVLAGLLTVCQLPVLVSLADYEGERYRFLGKQIVDLDLSPYFEGVEGSFVLYDLEADSYAIYNKAKSLTRVSPASTYKIYSGLIGLETGRIKAPGQVRRWDGREYPFPSWNGDQTLRSAMENSVNWYFQETDGEVGMGDLDSYFTRLAYGNHDLSGGIATYWMESTLRISPVEQVELLTKLCKNDTIFQPDHVDTMKEILRLEEKDGAVLSGKTGSGSVDGKGVNGWFVGYVEKKGHTVVFATNIQGEDQAGGKAAAWITLSILEDMEIF